MQFSLLKWPTGLDVPSRIPLSRGVPNAAAMAVDTRGMPRSLPLPEPVRQIPMDPEAASLPYVALARFAAKGGQVGSDVTNLLLIAEAKKRDADNLALTNSIYFDAAMKVDTGLEDLKTKSDHNTLRPAFNEYWKQVTQDAVAQAPNADVSRGVQLKLKGLQVVKSGEVADTVRKKTIDYHEASLETISRGAAVLITDPNTTEADRDLQIANLENYYLGYMGMGLPKDRLERMRATTLTSSFNTLARQDMLKDPEKFLPKTEDNPNGGDGYLKYGTTGKYRADPGYLSKLVDEVGPARILAIERRNAEETRRRESLTDAHLTSAWQQNFKQLLTDFYSDDPDKVAGASARVDAFVFESGAYAKNGEVETLLRARRDTARQGGVTRPEVYSKIQTELLRDPSTISREYILSWAGRGLAVTGDQSVTALLDKRETLLKGTDISQREDYKIGMRIIEASPLGSISIVSAAAAFNPEIKMDNVYWQADLHAKAIAEFDLRARAPAYAEKTENALRELAVDIAKKYTDLLMQRAGKMRESSTPGSTSGGTPGGRPKERP